MNCVSLSKMDTRSRGGFSLLEILVVVAIVGLLAGSGLFMMLAQMKQIDRSSTSRMEALQSARHALDTVSEAFSISWYRGDGGDDPYFWGVCNPSYRAYGNGVDDDGDGLIDEELYNGVSDSAQPWQSSYDLHAVLSGSWFERRYMRNVEDPGDLHLDVDTKFASSTLSFRVEPRPEDPAEVGRRVETYGIGTYEGKENVLLQTVDRYGILGEHLDTIVSPLAYNCLSFGARFWSDEDPTVTVTPPTNPPPAQSWNLTWDTRAQYQDDVNHRHRHIPSYVDFEVTVVEGGVEVVPGKEIPCVTLRTGVVSEGALKNYRLWHSNHLRNRRPNV